MIKGHYTNFIDEVTFLVRKLAVNTIILYGSVARTKADELSDIDLLLVTDSDLARKQVREIYSMIPESFLAKNRCLRLVAYSKKDFKKMYSEGSLFMAHVISEGVVLYDDGFYSRLRNKDFQLSKENLKISLAILRERLSLTDDLTKYNNFFIRCLAGFFALSKNIAYIALALEGQPVFDKKKAFAKLEKIYPSYKRKIRKLYGLRPFFLRNVRGLDVTLPFEPYDCKNRVARLRENVRELLNKVAEDAN